MTLVIMHTSINDNWIALAAAADATNKNASGIDDPVLIDITSAGKGDHRFDLSNNLVSVATIDCSLTTQKPLQWSFSNFYRH